MSSDFKTLVARLGEHLSRTYGLMLKLKRHAALHAIVATSGARRALKS